MKDTIRDLFLVACIIMLSPNIHIGAQACQPHGNHPTGVATVNQADPNCDGISAECFQMTLTHAAAPGNPFRFAWPAVPDETNCPQADISYVVLGAQNGPTPLPNNFNVPTSCGIWPQVSPIVIPVVLPLCELYTAGYYHEWFNPIPVGLGGIIVYAQTVVQYDIQGYWGTALSDTIVIVFQ